MANKLTVSSIQMSCIRYDKEANLKRAGELLSQAASKGAKLMVLPELFSTGYRVEDRDGELSEPIPGPTTAWMEGLARTYDAYIVGAIIEQGENGALYDTAVLVGPQGLVGRHRKMHLWGDEDKRFARGEQIDVFELPFGTVGLQICYEIGFPEMARIQAQKGAQILIYTSAFGRARYYAWDTASRGRALENGAFVVACNRSGKELDTDFGGLSRIVAPDTTIAASTGADGDAVVCAEIDLDMVPAMRGTLPYLRDLNGKLHNDRF